MMDPVRVLEMQRAGLSPDGTVVAGESVEADARVPLEWYDRKCMQLGAVQQTLRDITGYGYDAGQLPEAIREAISKAREEADEVDSICTDRWRAITQAAGVEDDTPAADVAKAITKYRLDVDHWKQQAERCGNDNVAISHQRDRLHQWHSEVAGAVATAGLDSSDRSQLHVRIRELDTQKRNLQQKLNELHTQISERECKLTQLLLKAIRNDNTNGVWLDEAKKLLGQDHADGR